MSPLDLLPGVRIQRKRTKGWRMPEGAVYVGRPTKWGNPFRYRTPYALARVPAAFEDRRWEYEGRISADGARHDYFHPDGRITRHDVRYMTHEELVECYRRRLTGDLSEAMRMAGIRPPSLDLTELAGRDLVCWCPLDQPCHADVLLELANPVAP